VTLSLPELRDMIGVARAMDAPVLLLPDEAEALADRVELAELDNAQWMEWAALQRPSGEAS
jgi:hypothetical protein